ncbi:hypothetical protein ACWDSD_04065 [Streptomyces spiralis]|uniref:hypothetical protein n=1 Tax=Streptomyces sp. NRRL S-813 TaxID=1463919 RepID=UPI0004BE529E|nr:hypothetical protein [Streptomyces sp. NRRL S-813]
MNSGGVRRRLALGLAVLTGSVTLALALPGAAQAAASTCSGREVRTLPFSTGSLHVYRQGGYVCAVTTPDRPGRKQSMSVTVQARGNRPVTDRGRYAYHAGPVTVHAGHRCVRVSGSVGGGSYTSGWILC